MDRPLDADHGHPVAEAEFAKLAQALEKSGMKQQHDAATGAAKKEYAQ